MIGGLLVVALLAQPWSDERIRINDHHEAALQYRRGNVATALAILGQYERQESQQVANAARRLVELPPDTPEPGEHALRPWTRAHLRALGALHMEAALRSFLPGGSPSSSEVLGHVAVAESVFDFLAEGTPPANDAPRWEFAIGLLAVAGGRVFQAEELLDRACRRYPSDARLRVACGSVFEVIAMLPARDLPLMSVYRHRPDRMAAVARADRSRKLDRAREHFEKAIELQPDSVEAHLRLAHVRLLDGDRGRAEQILTSLLREYSLDPRSAYLARLFLGRVRQEARDLEAALALYEEAATIIPSGQSALVALSRASFANGNAAAAAAAVDRMFAAPDQPGDPWWGYTLGPIWLVRPLLASLREEVRR